MKTKTRIKKKKSARTSVFKKRYFRFLLLSSLLLFLILLFFSGPRNVLQLYKSLQEKQKLQAEIDRLEQEKTRLDSLRSRLLNDPAYIEKVAREQYNMKKEREHVYKIVKESE